MWERFFQRGDARGRRGASEQAAARPLAVVDEPLTLRSDRYGRITSFGPGCESLTGRAHADAEGRAIWELMTRETEIELVRQSFDGIDDGHFPPGFVDHWRAFDGGERVVAWTTDVIKGPDGKALAVEFRGHDVTDAQDGLSQWSILNQIPAVVWTIDHDLRVSASIGAGLAGFGLKTGQLEGTSLMQFLHTSDPQHETLVRHRRALAGETTQDESEFLGRWFQSVIQPLRDASGTIRGAIGIAVDITGRKRAEQNLEAAMAREKAARLEAERLSRLKDEFLVTLSHELRTPLMPILGWSDLIANDALPQETLRNGLETIRRNAKIELHLIEDLLDVSRIVAGKLDLDVETVDVLPIVQAAIDVVQLAAAAKRIDVELDAGQQPLLVAGDAKRLQQVIWNLVANAVKFTPRAGKIGVRLERDGDFVKIAVADNGVGIEPGFLPHVFERFRQEDGSLSRDTSGLGIGLAIARHIVEAHGGSITAASAGKGRGATFTVALPAHAA